MSPATIAVLGGDLRQSYLAAYLCRFGHDVTCYATPDLSSQSECPFRTDHLREALFGARLVLCPVPLSTDGSTLSMSEAAQNPLPLKELVLSLHPGQLLAGGGLPESFSEACRRKEVVPFDYLMQEEFLRANAALTAEGLLGILLRETPFSLVGRRALLLGYGRCGQEIAGLLSCFSVKLSVHEKEPLLLAQAASKGFTSFSPELNPEDLPAFDLVINTVPGRVLNITHLHKLSARCHLFDIASAPFGFDRDMAQSTWLSPVRCPGLPGKWMPETAGELMGKIISERMLSHGV